MQELKIEILKKAFYKQLREIRVYKDRILILTDLGPLFSIRKPKKIFFKDIIQ
jgi:hypothetical protein